MIFNQGDTAARMGLIFGTLTDASLVTLPVLDLTYDLGAFFTSTPGLRARIEVTDADVAAVPAPSGLALAGLGLVLLTGLRRRSA